MPSSLTDLDPAFARDALLALAGIAYVVGFAAAAVAALARLAY
jgi:hypothetical protein